jgi:hypothetical protein
MFSNKSDLLLRNFWHNDWPQITKLGSQACEIWHYGRLHIAYEGSSSSGHHILDML